jgi:hypothetical protein
MLLQIHHQEHFLLVTVPTSESFTSSGTFSTIRYVTQADVLVVAGGGGGGLVLKGGCWWWWRRLED